MDTPDIPDSCKRGDHDWGQAGRCRGCGQLNELPPSRRSGGAGSLTAPLSDEDYRRQRRKLEQRE